MNQLRCTFPDCPTIGQQAFGLCPKHYRRRKRHGDPSIVRPRHALPNFDGPRVPPLDTASFFQTATMDEIMERRRAILQLEAEAEERRLREVDRYAV